MEKSQKEKQEIKSGLNILIPNGFSNLKSQNNGKLFGAFNIKFRFHKKKYLFASEEFLSIVLYIFQFFSVQRAKKYACNCIK